MAKRASRVRLPSGRDLDVVAMASNRLGKGTPLLADVYAEAAIAAVAAPPPRWWLTSRSGGNARRQDGLI